MGEQGEQNPGDTECPQPAINEALVNTEKNAGAVVDLFALDSQRVLGLEEKLLAGLTIGARCFAVPVGLIARVDAESCQVEYVVSEEGSPAKGQQSSLSQGFCRRVWAEGKTLVIEDVTAQESDYSADAFLPTTRAYLGARVAVNGRAYGTLCFTSARPEGRPYSVGDRAVVQLFAEWAGNEITTFLIEADLAAKAERMRCIVDNVVDGIITVNAEGVIESINTAVTKIFAYSAADLLAQPLQQLLTVPFDESQMLQDASANQANPYREVEGCRKGGEVFPLEVAVSALHIEGERLFIVIMRDVTERKRVESLKNQFISTVSHELRTPLTAIRGALGIVLGKEANSLSAKALKMLETANRNSERLTFLINDILDLEKIDAGEMNFDMRVIDVNAVAHRALIENGSYASKYNVHLALTPMEEALSFVLGDENRLLQVFANLLSNAIKFSPAGATVSVVIGNSGEGCVRITVKDAGAGIPEDFQSKIFARFSQADGSDTRQQGGTGLGLAVSKAIIEHHSGAMGFSSQLDVGSEFYFDLPQWQDVIRSQDHSDKPLVLICEDNLDVAYILSNLLEEQGLASDTAATGAAAKGLLAEKHYKLMLLDLSLPDTDGISLLRDLRADPATSTLPVIVVSANIGASANTGRGLSVIDWLQKPIDKQRLSQALFHALGGDSEYKILHVEDDLDVIQVVGEIVSGVADYHYATTLARARSLLEEHCFDLVILDLTLPDGEGVELLDHLAKTVQVVVFSGKEPDDYLAAHVDAALTKATVSNEQLLMTIRRVLSHQALEL
ncbi:MAG: response regulator [Porticoccaceae bacterium]|nr:response regulator [Porticoccaceae bacterium]